MKIYDYNGKKNICGERIREARLKQRLSQSDLAARVQVEGVIMERDSISRVEIGTRFVKYRYSQKSSAYLFCGFWALSNPGGIFLAGFYDTQKMCKLFSDSY